MIMKNCWYQYSNHTRMRHLRVWKWNKSLKKVFLKPKAQPNSHYVPRQTLLIDLVWLTFQSDSVICYHCISIVHLLKMNRIEQLLYSDTENSHFLSNVFSQMDTETL